MTFGLTRGTALLTSAVVVLFALARATGTAWLMMGSTAAFAVVVASLFARPRLTDLELTLIGPARVVAGRPLVRTLTVTNCGSLPVPHCAWQDHSGALGDFVVIVPRLLPGEVFTTQLTAVSPRRGVHSGRSILSSTAPFGVLRFERWLSGPELLVHPATSRLLLPGSIGKARNGQPSRLAGDGLEVLGLRPWRPGDHARSLSARASARYGHPIVLERERDDSQAPPLVVVAGGGPRPGWEDHVSRAASYALQALAEGRRVVLVSGAGPHRPVRAREQVLDFFARVDAAPTLSAEQIWNAARLVHPGGIVVQLAGAVAGTLLVARDSESRCCIVESLHA